MMASFYYNYQNSFRFLFKFKFCNPSLQQRAIIALISMRKQKPERFWFPNQSIHIKNILCEIHKIGDLRLIGFSVPSNDCCSILQLNEIGHN